MRHSFLLLALFVVLGMRAPAAAADAVATSNRGVRFDPVVRDIEGWTIHVEPALLEGELRADGARVLAMLANHLQWIKILVPKGPLVRLQQLEIWIEHGAVQGGMPGIRTTQVRFETASDAQNGVREYDWSGFLA